MTAATKQKNAVGDTYVAQRQHEFQQRLLVMAAAFLKGCASDTLHLSCFGDQGQYSLKVQASGAVTVCCSRTGQPLAQSTLEGLPNHG